MKKWILFFALIPIFIQAQSDGKVLGWATVWYDSLVTYSDTTASDSSWIIDLAYAYDFPSVAVVDTGTGIVDSLKAYKGIRVYAYSGARIESDTLWISTPLPLKTGAFANDTVMAGSGNYILLENSIDLLKIVRVNAVTTQANTTEVAVTAKKD